MEDASLAAHFLLNSDIVGPLLLNIEVEVSMALVFFPRPLE